MENWFAQGDGVVLAWYRIGRGVPRKPDQKREPCDRCVMV